MATHYKVVGPATGLTVGRAITDEDLNERHKGLGGTERLLKLKVIEKVSATEAEKLNSPAEGDPRAPENTTGDDADKATGPQADAQKQNRSATGPQGRTESRR